MDQTAERLEKGKAILELECNRDEVPPSFPPKIDIASASLKMQTACLELMISEDWTGAAQPEITRVVEAIKLVTAIDTRLATMLSSDEMTNKIVTEDDNAEGVKSE